MANEIKPIDEVRHVMGTMAGQFAMALPSHISTEKFQRVAITAIQQTPDLLYADRTSLYGACMKSAQDGLLPDGREAALVVFNTKSDNGGYKKVVQYMPMVAGIMKKIRNSGELKMIHASMVYEKDEFDYHVDTDGQHIRHKPVLFASDRGKAIGVYAMATTKDGGVYIETLSLQEVEKIRASSRSGEYGPWKSWYDEMAKKSAIRRLAKKLPQSTDLDTVLAQDKELFDPVTIEHETSAPPVEEPEPEKQKRPRRLDKIKETVIENDAIMPPEPPIEAYEQETAAEVI